MAHQELTTDGRRVQVVSGDLVIEPLDRNLVRVEYAGGIVIGFALKRPISVVVRSPAGTFSFDLEHAGLDDDGYRGLR